MATFRDLLGQICARPAMYVGHCSLVSVSNYLTGYCHCLSDTGQEETPMDGFMRWTEMRFRIRHPAWHWTRILLHAYGNDWAAISALPALFDEFVVDREQLGIEGIEAETTKRLKAEYGKDWGEPEQTTTTPFGMA